MNKRNRFLLADDLSGLIIFQIIFFNFNLQSTATQLTFNLRKIMIFSVSNAESNGLSILVPTLLLLQ